MAMIDAMVSIAAFAMLRQWLRTVEIKSSFPASVKAVCPKPGAVWPLSKDTHFAQAPTAVLVSATIARQLWRGT